MFKVNTSTDDYMSIILTHEWQPKLSVLYR